VRVKTVGYYVDLAGLTLSDGDHPQSWVHALPGGTYKHPVYGEMVFDEPKVTNLAASVTNKTRGIEPDIDYDHKQDKAMGNQAAGWVKQADVRPSSDGTKKDLYLLVEWTPTGAQKIRNKEYRYFSSEFADEWEDATGTKHKDVLLGGGVTNRPYMKNLLPLNLSELQFSDDQPNKGEQVDPKELRRKLGLSETASDADVDAKLAEVAKLGAPEPPKTDKEDDELKKLAEGNPLIKAFMERMTAQDKVLADMQGQLVLSNVTRQLTEFTRGDAKVQLSAATLNSVRDLLIAAPQALGEKFFNVLKGIVGGEGITLMGEFAKGQPNADRGDGGGADFAKQFNDKIDKLMSDDKLDYVTAAERVALMEPDFFEKYRASTYLKPKDA